MNKKWQVMEEVGEEILEGIGSNVKKWNLNADSLTNIEDEVEEYRHAASPVGYAIDRAVWHGYLADIGKIVENLSEEEQQAILHAHMGALALVRSKELARGTSFGEGKKARVTVLDYGVTRRRGIIEEGHQIHLLGKKRSAEPGEVFIGRVHKLEGIPKLGGILRLESWHTTVLTGLVSPATGEPQVQLELLGKT